MIDRMEDDDLRALRIALGRDTQLSDAERASAIRLVAEHERQRADLTAALREVDALRAELKRMKIGALNDASEVADLRATIMELREQLDDLLSVGGGT